MKLMTPELEARFAEIGDQSQEIDPIAIAKFILDDGAFEFYTISYTPHDYTPDDWIFYGFADSFSMGDMDEWVEISLKHLKEDDYVVRDMEFSEQRLSEALGKRFEISCRPLREEAMEEQKMGKEERYAERMAQTETMQKDHSQDKEDGFERE